MPNPLQIDLATLSGTSVDFWIDTSGAGADFAMGTCSPFPDVVVAIRNASGMRRIGCAAGTGSGGYTYGDTNYPRCTATIATFFSSSCNGGSTRYSILWVRPPALPLLFRDQTARD